MFYYCQGMTQLMVLATYSVRVQTDIAPQSQFMPMITLYYVLGISFVLIALCWFIIANNWTTKQNIPAFLVKFASIIKRILFWYVILLFI
jgi:hypothetical protein